MDALPVVDQPVEEADPAAEVTNRRFAAAPVEGGVGLRVVDLGRGRLTLEVPLRPGVPYLVPLAVAVDTAVGIAVHSTPETRIAGP
ncbi:hypothetical protein, partial [Pseudonocardia pini]|uniref:hypothetical protein n=1 Tax=Pseudonocardia pini TaxID=2758030 RepID=UPI0015EFF0C1